MTAEERQGKKETSEQGKGREGEGHRVTTISVFFMKPSILYNESAAIKINGKEEKRLEKMFSHDTHCPINKETHLILISLALPFWLCS